MSDNVTEYLLARIGELEETIRKLREPVLSIQMLPAKWGLTPRERDILAALYMSRRDYTERVVLMEAMYGDDTGDVQEQIITVWIAKIRKKIKPFGMSIESKYGIGYRLTDETKQIIRDAISPIAKEGDDVIR
jgi:two-component system cell cycle response regulator CtrA